VNDAVGKLIRCHTRETEFDIVDQTSDRRALRREQNPTERVALPLPLRSSALSAQAYAADIKTITARVVGVHDGGTITVLTDDKQLNVRLRGIDAPELGQPCGQASKRALSDLVFGKQVTLHTTGTDRYKPLWPM